MNEIGMPPNLVPTGDTDAFIITAPVELPTQEQMKVKLVPSHLLSRFDDARSDEQYWGSVFWTFIGAIMGAIITWATTDPITITVPSLIIVGLMGLFGFLSYRAFSKYRARARRFKDEIEARGEILSDLEQ